MTPEVALDWFDTSKPDIEKLAKRDNADNYISISREGVGPEPG